jgi:hypothetical protein
MHVFDFSEKQHYLDIAGYGGGHVFAGKAFAHWLIENGHLTQIAQANAQNGDIVFYFSKGEFTHAGLWCDGRVISKWGIGHLYEHQILEVPSSYGSEVRFYSRIGHEDALSLFRTFAER